ncbi:MAG: T9SS type A sorting domain-containing protein [Chitinivibrionales bacterium]|nr:T9SS type A sorting domain-containing protein [Chitinivibrionales bacterium]
MEKGKIFLLLGTTVLLLAGHVLGACEWFRSVNRPRAWLEVCAELSPDGNADPNGFTAYEPAEFSTTRCRIGDTLTFKFTVGRNANSDGLFVGHLTRQDARCGGVKNLNSTDPGAISYYMFPNTGRECWRGMMSYPDNEEGLQFNAPSVRDKIGFDGSRNNLITLRMIVPEMGGDGQEYYLEEQPLWICFAQYHKDSPLYYCIDARGGSVNERNNSTQPAPNGISIARIDGKLTIAFPGNGTSSFSVNSIDGRTLLQQRIMHKSATVPLHALRSGTYILYATSGGSTIAKSLIVP